MGCDIHVHVEIKLEDGWHHYQALSPNRDYEVFCKMAGVRCGSAARSPIALPRGLPTDATTVTRLDRAEYENDAHHESWLDAGEVAELAAWFSNRDEKSLNGLEGFLRSYFFGNPYSDKTYWPSAIKNMRLVFWFG
jgi:hypothetical protein